MKVTKKDVAKVAGLAHLELSVDEQSRMVRDLNSILEHVERLSELDTTNVPAMTQVFGIVANLPAESSHQGAQQLRDDIAEGLRPSLPHEEALANALDSDGVFFVVPRVIER